MSAVEEVALPSRGANEAVVVDDPFLGRGVGAKTLLVSPHLRRVRFQAALVRALLEELEEAVPLALADVPFEASCAEQLSKELTALARRLRDCVAAMTDVPPPP